jgi:hypothetical protein
MKIDAKVFEEQYKALCTKMLLVYVDQFENDTKALGTPEKILEA